MRHRIYRYRLFQILFTIDINEVLRNIHKFRKRTPNKRIVPNYFDIAKKWFCQSLQHTAALCAQLGNMFWRFIAHLLCCGCFVSFSDMSTCANEEYKYLRWWTYIALFLFLGPYRTQVGEFRFRYTYTFIGIQSTIFSFR